MFNSSANSDFITLDPINKKFILSPKQSIHQRKMFINTKLNPSLNVIKHVKEEECNKSLCH
jgi:hypothetical protein